jgi:nitrite reductase/ring-hydroxylating ferredoxin subunit
MAQFDGVFESLTECTLGHDDLLQVSGEKIVYKISRFGQIGGYPGRNRIQTINYTQGDAFQTEKRTVFSRGWLPLCAEGQIAQPGDFLAQSVGGWSVLGVRDKAGAVRVLRNACRHQNMPVAGQPAGNCESFRCRFHGWTYDLQGRFLSAPPPVAPADISAGANDLQVLPVRQAAGLVFFAMEAGAAGAVPSDPGQAYAGTTVTDIACNWKVCVEHLLGSEPTWFPPLLAVRRSGAAVLVDQVVPHTFLRTKLFTHVFGGAAEAQTGAGLKEACELLQAERANGTPAQGGALVAAFHKQLDEAYAGNS